MTDDPGWALVLAALYNGQASQIRHRSDPHDENIVTRQELSKCIPDMSEKDVNEAVDYLESCGLLQLSDTGTERYELTSRGFHVAHERKMVEIQDEREDARLERQEEQENRRTERQHSINLAVAALTLGLMAVTAVDSLVRAAVGAGDTIFAYSLALAASGIVVLLGYRLHKSESTTLLTT